MILDVSSLKLLIRENCWWFARLVVVIITVIISVGRADADTKKCNRL